MRNGRLLALLTGELVLLVLLALLGDLRRHVPLFLMVFALLAALYFTAALLAMRARLPLLAVITIAVALRVPLFFTQPSLSDDVWRYLHDGRAQHAGINPYALAPADARTQTFRGPEHARINHPQLPTIYPPAAQYTFRLATSYAAPLFAWRLILLAAEIALLIAGALLLRQRGQSPANLALYAWHPLAIIENIGSAHLEPLAIALLLIALLLAARQSVAASAAVLAASVASKLVAAPLLLFAAPRRAVPVFLVTLLVLYLPFLDGTANVLGSLGTFAQSWASNASVAALGVPLLGAGAYRLAAISALAVVLIMLKRQRLAAGDVAISYFLVLFVLSPVVHPWYLLWLLALLPLRRDPFDTVGKAVLVWTVTVALAYLAHHQLLTQGVWRLPWYVLGAEYLPVLSVLLYGMRQKSSGAFSMMNLRPSNRKTVAKM